MISDITNKDKLICAKRELALRRVIYPRRVAQEKLSAGKAALEIACMEAIVADYEATCMEATAADFWEEQKAEVAFGKEELAKRKPT